MLQPGRIGRSHVAEAVRDKACIQWQSMPRWHIPLKVIKQVHSLAALFRASMWVYVSLFL